MIFLSDTIARGIALANKAQLADSAKKQTNIFNLKQYESYMTSGDWIPAFTKAFSDMAAVGGGILYIHAGTFYIKSTLTIPSKVHVVGMGMGVSIIRIDSGVDCDIVTFDTNDFCGIRNLSIRGNNDSAVPANNKDGLVIGRPGLDPIANNGVLDRIIIQDIDIQSVTGNGFHCYPSTWVYSISRMRVNYSNNYNMLVESTDNIYDNIYLSASGKAGLYLTGSNNKFSNMKIIFCGTNNTLTDMERVGVYCKGSRNSLSNIEAQENYGHGFVFDGSIDYDLNGLLSDANGYSMIANNGSTPTGTGFYFKGCKRMSGTLKATNFKSTLSQKNGYIINSDCNSLAFDYENDRTGTSDINNS
jgi:hypothetical protein